MESLKNRNAWLWVIISGAIGWCMNHALDSTRTGFIKISGIIVAIVTLGSTRVRDAPYSMAALNPYPVPSLMMLYVAFFLGAFLMASYSGGLARTYLHPDFIFKRRANQLHRKSQPPEYGDGLIGKPRYVRFAFSFITPVFLVMVVFVPVTTTNKAVAIRRLYEANKDILAPVLHPDEIAEIQARFGSITTKAEYDQLQSYMSILAAQHRLKLRPEDVR